MDEPSAAALASKISLAENVEGGGLYQCPNASGRATVYESETWTLPVTVAAGASGDVTLTLDPEGLTRCGDPPATRLSSAGSTLSLTVSVNRPGESVPETEPVVFGSANNSLEFSIVFEEDGVSYEGTAKPYITIYLGERVPANERHAVWAREEDVNSTRVTFEYEVGAVDFASEVSLKSEVGVAIPKGTTFVSESVRIEGNDPPARAAGEAPPDSTAAPSQPAAGFLRRLPLVGISASP